MTRTIVISGAGSGIGRAAAVELAKASPDTSFVLIGRRAGPLEETASLLPKAQQHPIVTVAQDDQDALRRALSKMDLPSRNVVGVVANAGVGGENRYGEGDRWDEIININLSGTYYLIGECMPALMASKTKPRNIVIVSSILARMGVPGYTAYCASKAGLLGLMRSLATSHAKHDIYVNAVCPGWVETDMARMGIDLLAKHTKQSYDKAYADQMAMVPTRKMSTPAEVGGLISYIMCSGQASFTGQCFDINNGALMP
jgi:NAD(P)-dependent dehydrogenase (short-subunit alcohol dehydrogenase family)